LTQIVKGLYTAVLAGLAVYALHVLVLIVLYLKHRHDAVPPLPLLDEADLPVVTVQIPLRNERHVAQQVLRAVAALDWPRDRLYIQVLDDSDDETTAIVVAEALRLRQAGAWIDVLHRDDPVGYKAGALIEGNRRAYGDFIALFDADFCPAPDFLRQTVPHLVGDPTLGMVQARWTHLNADYSIITRIQALALDAHFSVEHLARNRSGLLMNFNGAAGVWRRAAILDAGGWQTDTVTEDLDLSYRAQLAGWGVRYLPDVVAPAELPPLVSALKVQQIRWAKGASQCLRKLAGPLVRSRRLSWAQKVMALLHLSGYTNQPLILCMMLLTLPVIWTNPDFSGLVVWLGALASIPPLLYVLGQMRFYRDWWRRVLVYPVLMLFWAGFSWSITLAVVEGLVRWGGDFIRTPKFRIRGRAGSWRASAYRPHLDATWVGELVIGGYVALAIWLAIRMGHGDLLPLALVYALGEIVLLGTTAAQMLAGSLSSKDKSNDPRR
jgi:cellulose synthase/poly-beta-1,6-N-acetylglucosamine synthase-like glycosyltransferase